MIEEKHVKRLERATAQLQALDGRIRSQLDDVLAATVEARKLLHVAEAWSRPAPTRAAALEVRRPPAASSSSRPLELDEGGFPTRGGLVPAQQRLLDTLALLERLGIPSSRDTLAAWYGSHPNSKGYTNNLSVLRSRGLVDGFVLTDAGRAAAAPIEIPTQAEARARIMKPLTPKQRQILDELIGWYPRKMHREELAKVIGVHPNSKSFNNNLSALRSRQLITKGWPTQAGEVLFLKAGGA
jgi:hypothetical protein